MDLNVFPNTDIFLQAELAVQKAYTSGYNTARATLRATQKKHSVYDKTSSTDIEVLVARRGSDVLLRWLLSIEKADRGETL